VKRAEYPERTCREPVAAGFMTYSCEVAENHDGPCASLSSPTSVKIRDDWEERQRQAKAAQEAASAKKKPAARGRRNV
jgi:hypothetical protein